jgi:putative membrane protein
LYLNGTETDFMYGYGHNWGMMGGGFGGLGGFNMVFWLLALVLLVGGVVWFMRSSPSIGLGRQAATRPGGLDLLEQRYARGEVDREEYLQKKGDLQA